METLPEPPALSFQFVGETRGLEWVEKLRLPRGALCPRQPATMEVQVAIDDIGKAIPVLRTVSMVVPQARALATLKYAATGTYAFVGSAQAEGKVVDSVSDQVLAAGVDKRVGGGSIATAAQWQLGDAENALAAWSKQLADRLSSWTSGTAASWAALAPAPPWIWLTVARPDSTVRRYGNDPTKREEVTRRNCPCDFSQG